MNFIEKIKSVSQKAKMRRERVARYDFILNLSPSQYPNVLKDLYFIAMKGKCELNLENPKTFSEKIQWLKIYDDIPKKTILSDKIAAPEYVAKIIGNDYIKPILWKGKTFDEIPFKELPNSFFIKTNHGCKWQVLIKDKENFLKNKKLFKYIKQRFKQWLNSNFFAVGLLETQYKDIKPAIFIEQALLNLEEHSPIDIEVYCFNGVAKILRKLKYKPEPQGSVYDENFININDFAQPKLKIVDFGVCEFLKKAKELSEILSKEFKFVRVDWIVFQDKLYFNEMTFTPCSGIFYFNNPNFDKYLSNMLVLNLKERIKVDER